MTRSRRFALPLTASLAVTALAGCGSGAPARLTATHLSARGSDACGALNSTLVALPEPASSSSPDLASYLDRVEVAVRAEYRTLSGLRPPATEQAAFVRFLSSVRRRQAKLTGADAAAHAGSQDARGRLASAVVYGVEVLTPLAQQLGFSHCST